MKKILMFLLAALQLNAATWYVDASNGGTANGYTIVTALTSIEAALDSAANGDDVIIMPGTYTETGNYSFTKTGTSTNWFKIQGIGEVVWQTGTLELMGVADGVEYLLIDNIRFVHGTTANTDGALFFAGSASNVRINGCRFTTGSNQNKAIRAAGSAEVLTNFYVQGCIFNNFIIAVDLNTVGNGSTVYIENNTIYNPAVIAAGSGIRLNSNSSSSAISGFIRNNIIQNHANGVSAATGVYNVSVTNNNFYANTADISGGKLTLAASNLDTDPGYVNTTDFKLSATSSMRYAGISGASIGAQQYQLVNLGN